MNLFYGAGIYESLVGSAYRSFEGAMGCDISFHDIVDHCYDMRKIKVRGDDDVFSVAQTEVVPAVFMTMRQGRRHSSMDGRQFHIADGGPSTSDEWNHYHFDEQSPLVSDSTPGDESEYEVGPSDNDYVQEPPEKIDPPVGKELPPSKPVKGGGFLG